MMLCSSKNCFSGDDSGAGGDLFTEEVTITGDGTLNCGLCSVIERIGEGTMSSWRKGES